MRVAFSTLLFIFVINGSLQAQEETGSDKKGFFNITEAGYKNVNSGELSRRGQNSQPSTSLDTDGSYAISLRTIFGYHIWDRFSAGIGVGLDGYANPDNNTMPVFADLRYYFLGGDRSVFLVLDYGAAVKIGDSFRRGPMGDLGIGYKFKSGPYKIISSINLSAKGLSLTGERYTEADRAYNLRGIRFSVGLMF